MKEARLFNELFFRFWGPKILGPELYCAILKKVMNSNCSTLDQTEPFPFNCTEEWEK